MRFISGKPRGFSLIELMVVISIVSTVTALSIPTMKNFTARAKEQEGNINVRTFYTTVKAAIDSETGGGGLVQADGGFASTVITKNDFSTATSCHNFGGSSLGWRPPDCRRMNFIYFFSSEKNQAAVTAVEAGAINEKKIYSKCCGSSMWVANSGGTYNTSPFRGPNCTSNINSLIMAAVGTGNLQYDLSGNGAVDANDATVLAVAAGLPEDIIGTQPSHISSCP